MPRKPATIPTPTVGVTKAKGKSNVCFFVAPIGKEGEPARKRSDDIFEIIIEPLAMGHGLEPIRADKIDESGFIDTQIIRHLMEAPIVIADFWQYNPNVFYELAIRHFVKKPVIHLYFDTIPFDVSRMRAIQLNHQDMRSVEDAKVSMANQLTEALRPGFVQWSPITHAIEIERLTESGSEADNKIAELAGDVERLRADLRRVETAQATAIPAYRFPDYTSLPYISPSGSAIVVGSGTPIMGSAVYSAPVPIVGETVTLEDLATPPSLARARLGVKKSPEEPQGK